MNLLVTGGSGFVGGHLLPLLRSRGHDYRFTSTSELPDPRCLRLHLPDEKRCLEILEASRPQAVIHLAGMAFVLEAEKDPVRAAEVNVEGTLGILKALRAFDPAGKVRYVHVSTSQVYEARTGGSLDEEAPLCPPNVYARTKLAAELLVPIYARSDGREFVIFRPFNHIGPGQRETFAASSFARQVAAMERGLAAGAEGESSAALEVGDLDVRRDFCDVRDIVKAYCLAAEGRVPQGIYNLASGTATALSTVVDCLGRLSARPFEVRVKKERLRPAEAPSVSGSAAKVKSVCGWKAEIPLEVSLGDTLEWWRKREDV